MARNTLPSAKESDRAAAPLWKAYHLDRSAANRNRLVEHYLYLAKLRAYKVAWRLPPETRLDEGDMQSVGVLGLMQAIADFDPERGVSFPSFAQTRIWGAMQDALRETDWVPRLDRRKQRQLELAVVFLESELGRPPTDTELAEQLRVSVDDVGAYRAAANTPSSISLDKPVAGKIDGRSLTVGDLRPDPRAADPATASYQDDFWRQVCRGCSKVERLTLIGYYRLHMSMKELGASIGLTESRISQVHTLVIRRLKSIFTNPSQLTC